MSDENCFTKVFFKKFPLIEEKTIQSLITNGYTNEELLLFFNLEIDLPLIPDLSMAQKSLLRLILSEYQESQKNLRQSFVKKLAEELNVIKTDADENQVQNVGQQVTKSPEQLSVPESSAPKHCKTVVSVVRSTSPELPAISSTSNRYVLNPSTSRQTMSSFPEIPISLKSGVSTLASNPYSDLNIASNVDIKVENIEEDVQTTDPITIVELSSDESDDENQTEELDETVEQLPLPKGLTPIHCNPVIIIDRLSTSPELPEISSTSDVYLNPSTSRQTMSSFPEIPISLKSGVSNLTPNPHSDLNSESNVDIRVENIEEVVQTTDPITIVELSSDDSDDENKFIKIKELLRQLTQEMERIFVQSNEENNSIGSGLSLPSNSHQSEEQSDENSEVISDSTVNLNQNVGQRPTQPENTDPIDVVMSSDESDDENQMISLEKRLRQFRQTVAPEEMSGPSSAGHDIVPQSPAEQQKTVRRRKSNGKKQFRCDECNGRFTRSAYLIKHKRVHTGERPYTCFHCNKKYADASYLKIHNRIHTGEKPYKCQEPDCDKAYISSKSLVRHNRIHTGEKPYSCKFCRKRFRDSGSRNYHQKHIH